VLNAEIAATLQYITLPLELIGLTLATIEVRFAALTARINRWLEAQVDNWIAAKQQLKIEHPWLYKLHGGDTRAHIPAPMWIYWVLSVTLVGIFVAAVVVLSSRLAAELGWIAQNVHESIDAFYVLLVLGFFVPVAFIATLLLGMTLIAVRFVSNRAVGTLGIIIAGLGVLGEIYQFAVQIAGGFAE